MQDKRHYASIIQSLHPTTSWVCGDVVVTVAQKGQRHIRENTTTRDPKDKRHSWQLRRKVGPTRTHNPWRKTHQGRRYRGLQTPTGFSWCQQWQSFHKKHPSAAKNAKPTIIHAIDNPPSKPGLTQKLFYHTRRQAMECFTISDSVNRFKNAYDAYTNVAHL